MVGLGLQNDRQVLTVLTSIGERLYREEGREGRRGEKGGREGRVLVQCKNIHKDAELPMRSPSLIAFIHTKSS